MPRATIATALVVVALARSASADEIVDVNLRVRSRSTLRTEGGSEVTLPAGVRIVDEKRYEKLDAEVRRLQEVETRLSAENASLRATSDDSVTWTAVAILSAASLLGGAYLGWRVSR